MGKAFAVNHGKRIEPGPGQESVWDYPHPPRLEESHKHIKVIFNGVVIAETERAKRILETSHPPVYYIPPSSTSLLHSVRHFVNGKGRPLTIPSQLVTKA